MENNIWKMTEENEKIDFSSCLALSPNHFNKTISALYSSFGTYLCNIQ